MAYPMTSFDMTAIIVRSHPAGTHGLPVTSFDVTVILVMK